MNNRVESSTSKRARSGKNKQGLKKAGFAARIKSGKDSGGAASFDYNVLQIAHTADLQYLDIVSCVTSSEPFY